MVTGFDMDIPVLCTVQHVLQFEIETCVLGSLPADACDIPAAVHHETH